MRRLRQLLRINHWILPAAAVFTGLVIALLTHRPGAIGLLSAPKLAPSVAVVLAGRDPSGLEAAGLLDGLRRPRSPGVRWVGGDLIPVPGASDAVLWRRAVTGRFGPRPSSPDLFRQQDVSVYGRWTAVADPDLDLQRLTQMRSRLRGGESERASGVVLLSCSRSARGLEDDGCREAFFEGVRLLEETARLGGTGVMLCVPLDGFPQTGTVWVVGESVRETGTIRFRMIDLAPTMLYLLNKPLPSDLDGAPGYEMMRTEHLFHHPVRWIGGGS